MNYIALEQYNDVDFQIISSCSNIQGVILGDLFCQKRMFSYGETEMMDMIRLAHEKNLDVIYQTPRYLTDRKFDSTMHLVSYLYEKELIKKIILQDIGAVHYLRRKYPSLHIIWGFMGDSRNGADNLLHFSFLKSIGVNEIECSRISRIPYLAEMGFEIMLMNERVTYNTVNRECYYTHEFEIYDNNCGRRCLDSEASLCNKACGFDFSINGHMLGMRYHPLTAEELDNVCTTDIVYRGKDINSIDSRLLENLGDNTNGKM